MMTEARPGIPEMRSGLELRELCQVCLPQVALKGHVCELTLTGDLNEPGGFQLFEVVGQGGGRDGESGAQVHAGRAGLRRDALEDLEASRIGEDPADGADLSRRDRRTPGGFRKCGHGPLL